MTISMYQASVPVFIHMLENLARITEKGASHAEARKIEPAVLINYRLYPDMLPFSKQIQVATDMAKGCAARLAGQEPVKFEDNEASFPELLARIAKTVDYLKTFPSRSMAAKESRSRLKCARARSRSRVWNIYSILPIPIFIFMSRPRTTSCAMPAWKLARWTISAGPDTARGRTRIVPAAGVEIPPAHLPALPRR